MENTPLSSSATLLDYERLDVYKVAIELVALATQIADALPKKHAYAADQLRRAAFSIVLNIAEGVGKPTLPDKRRYYAIARGSAMECGAVLDALLVMKLLRPEMHATGKALVVRIVSMLTRMIR
jgi:four helix bundle protein